MARDPRVCSVGGSCTVGTGDGTGAGWVRPVVAARLRDGDDGAHPGAAGHRWSTELVREPLLHPPGWSALPLVVTAS